MPLHFKCLAECDECIKKEEILVREDEDGVLSISPLAEYTGWLIQQNKGHFGVTTSVQCAIHRKPLSKFVF